MNTKSKTLDTALFDTNIQTLGQAKIPSHLHYHTLPDDASVSCFLDSELVEELHDHEAIPVKFELAGPRKHLYFDSSKTKCAIVTCGGLCPGINDVIQSIVMEATHNYNVPAILGIQYGLEGFIPKFHHDVKELTPNNVARTSRA